MKNRSVLAALLTLGLSVLQIPAAHAVEPHGTCPSPEAATQAEVEQLHVGMKMVDVFTIIGSRGVRKPESDTADYRVRQWVYCGDGFESRQSVMFDPGPRGGWRVYEIG
jgi:hypothetical protein